LHVSAAAEHSDIPPMMVGFEIVAVLQVGLGALLVWGRPSRPLFASGPGGESSHRHRHPDRRGTDHGRSRASHPAGSAPTHAHGPELAVAPVHDHALASAPGVVAGSGHAHTGSGTTFGSEHPAGGADHGTHPPGHDSGYGGSGGEPPAPPPEEPAPVLGDAAGEVDKLVP
jgi:hypothetical protein